MRIRQLQCRHPGRLSMTAPFSRILFGRGIGRGVQSWLRVRKGKSRLSLKSPLILFLALASPSLSWFEGHDRQAAREAFARARDYLKEFHYKPLTDRRARDYDKGIRLFLKVVDHDPTYGGADDALFRVARLYDERHQRFGEPRDLKRAIQYYEFVSKEYPLTRYRKAALQRVEGLRAESVASVGAAAGALAARGETAESVQVSALQQPSGEPATVDRIRYWSGPDYTRVVIDLDREVKFDRKILRDPPRLYFDLRNARLNPGAEPLHEVNDVFIKSVRVGHNRPGVVRVVLDFAQPGRTTVFPLWSPFRLVIDTRAEDSAEAQGESLRTASADIPLREGAEAARDSAERPAAAAPNLGGDLSLTRTLGLKIRRIVLDPGHGGHDLGAVGRAGLREKELVLDVSKRLRRLLVERLGTDVILTRTSDVFVPLEERTAIANQKNADLFVSIHANSSRSRQARGLETFYLSFASSAEEREVASRENAASQRSISELEDLLKQITQGDYNQESRDLAHVMQDSLAKGLRKHRPAFKDRGVKRAPFIVLLGSRMPSVLIEIGFVSNPAEERYLRRNETREKIAEALYKGLERYIRLLGAPVSADSSSSSQRP